MKTGLLITDVKFWIKGAGHKSRVEALVVYLARYFYLKIIFVGAADAKDEGNFRFENAELLILEKVIALKPSGYGQKLKQLTSAMQADFCIIEYIHNAYLLNYLPEGIKTFLDTHDILSRRKESFGKFSFVDEFRNIDPEMERAIMGVFDYIMLISRPDFNYMLDFFPPTKLLYVSHAPRCCQRISRENINNISFLGSEYVPNADNIFPGVYAKWKIPLMVYGNVCKKISRLSGVRGVFLQGFIQDSNDFYDHAGIIINPVRFGAGIKIKNLEALANCVPLITTSHGAEGLDEVKDYILVADDEKGFSAAMTKLLAPGSFRNEMVSGAYHAISTHFSQQQCYGELVEIINR
jgi:glycosyltransferase involved in cell wall biosynthesis